ncbi:MAG: hypothetical protein F6K19_27950 [Cyanothece sp. SIO1E1]|nr:hypothetical protein [Cyanothece sp. SIO1E1]
MKLLSLLTSVPVFILCIIIVPPKGNTQCPVFQELPEKEKRAAEDSYVVYRDRLKEEDYEVAFMHWEIVYQSAAAADGQRHTVYADGRKLQLRKFRSADSQKTKAEIAKVFFTLRAQQKECYPEIALEAIPVELLEFKKK